MALSESLSLMGFAFSAGALTFFAPCAYPLLPGYISYYLGNDEPGGGAPAAGRVTGRVADALAIAVAEPRATRLARAAVVGVWVSAGFFLVYGALAGTVVAIGVRTLSGISALELVVGIALVALGGVMALGREPPTLSVALPERHRSPAGYLGFGVLYAAAAAGCTGPIFIGVALEALSSGVGFGIATLLAYAAGMSALMIGVTVATALGRDALLSRLTGRMGLIRRVSGALLLLAGLVEIYLFVFRFRGLALLGFCE